MSHQTSAVSAHEQLVRVVRQVRSRWRWKLALKGVALALAGGLGVFLLAGLALERWGAAPSTLLVVRALTYGALVGLLVWFVARPLRRRVSDEQVALYLEEHEPSLQAALVSALEVGSETRGAPGELSPALARRTIETALERCRGIEYGRRIERRGLARSGGMLGGVFGAVVLLMLISPAFLKNSASRLFLPSPTAEAASAVRIDVLPGNATVPRGADQEVSARLQGFGAEAVELVLRAAGDSTFERLPMIAASEEDEFEVLLFDVDQPTEYFVEANGVRSPVFRIGVSDLPYVQRLELEYRFPAYTGLPAQQVEDGGDIAAPAGTVVRVRATPTVRVEGGRIVLSDGKVIPLQVDSAGLLSGEIRVGRRGFYHVELQGQNRELTNASPQYTIDVLSDEGPSVSFTEPGRDTRVTPIEEVFVEARAEDDFGVASLQLVFSVNGGPEQTRSLYQAGRPLPEVSAGHTFYLEEFGLVPGDFVSYYARATDNNAVGGRRTATSDIYFLNVRPFGREYRQADERGGGAGAGQGGGSEEADAANGQLSQRQREIIAATFNLVRDRNRYTDKEFGEHLVTISLAQERLREQALTLATRMNNRGVTGDSAFRSIAELLPAAAAEMETVTEILRRRQPREALPPEQRALQHLQRAEAVFREVQISMSGQQGGPGGGGSPNAEDLADLFGLEADQLRNQYETVQRGRQQPERVQEELDGTLERLKELARRQEQENERLRQLALRSQAGQPGGRSAEGQRQLAEETEAAARQLERLARETARPELMESARRLKEAADAMRRSAAGGQSGNSGQASAALDRLDDARRLLERDRATTLEDQVRQAQARAEQLGEEQREIASEMQDLPRAGAERAERARRLLDRKEQQARDVAELERQLDRTAAGARREQPQAARELQDAANSIRENRLQDKIRRSRAGTQPGAPPEYVRRFEEEIASNLDDVRREISEVGGAIGRSGEERGRETLDRARDLARGLESLQERTRNAQEQAEGQAAGRDPGRQTQAQAQAGQRESPQQGGEPSGNQPRGQQSSGEQAGGQQASDQQAGGQQTGGEPAGGEQANAETGGQQGGGSPGDGVAQPGTGWTGGGTLNPEQIRQFRREARERLEQAEELRRRMRAENFSSVGDLDDILAGLRKLDDQRVYSDPAELDRLHAQVVDGIKQLEYGMRLGLDEKERERLYLSRSSEVPAGFREMVEEYYRSLSERPKR